MHKTLSLIFILLSINLFAQVPVPELCAVTVDTLLGRPVLYWSVCDTGAIDGFIIKRIIWGGMGVLDGTLNNVAVINDPEAQSFTDTTTTYGTHASPGQRSEQYVIVAFRNVSGNQVYSSFSQSLSSLYLKAEYDSCSTTVRLSWHTNQDISQYRVFLITGTGLHRLTTTKDTQFVYSPINHGFYRFLVSGSLSKPCQTDTVISNIAEARIDFFQRPRLLYIQGVSAAGDDTLELKLHVLLPVNKPQVELWMDGMQMARFDDDFIGNYLVNTSAHKRHWFMLKAFSACGDQIDSSNRAHNIVLQGSYAQSAADATVALWWEAYDYSAGSHGKWNVYFSEDDKDFQWLATSADTNYTHVLNDLIVTHMLPSTLYYYVSATQVNDTLAGQVATVRSDILKVEPPVLLLLPNAINPMSPDERDRQFKVQLDFADSYELTIFDRYGRILFHSTNPAEAWEGKDANGQLVPVDTYFYQLKYTVHGRKKKFRGSISVLY